VNSYGATLGALQESNRALLVVAVVRAAQVSYLEEQLNAKDAQLQEDGHHPGRPGRERDQQGRERRAVQARAVALQQMIDGMLFAGGFSLPSDLKGSHWTTRSTMP